MGQTRTARAASVPSKLVVFNKKKTFKILQFQQLQQFSHFHEKMSSTMTRLQSSPTTGVFVPTPNTQLPLSFLTPKRGRFPSSTVQAVSSNGAASRSSSEPVSSGSVQDARRQSSLEALFCYDKAIPEEIIETPVGLSLSEKVTGDNARCTDCHAKGAVLCTTCSGSGLYVDSILESQGIIVKVRCLGCGGSGNVLCSECGGRGHLGIK